MTDATGLLFELPAVCRKKVSAAFDLGEVSSNGGLLLLREVERRLGLGRRLAECLRDRRSAERIEHTQVEMLRMRMLAIAAGYEDADDCDSLRHDPIMKMAVGRTPISGEALCSQPTMSRLENAPSRLEVARLSVAMLDLFLDSYPRSPRRIVLDIDDTVDAVHGGQQLSLFNAHYRERCFLPIHIYEAISGKPVAMVLRAGAVPSGREVSILLKHLIRRIRARWPGVRILLRGDAHYGRCEVMDWCDANRVGYIFGLQGNPVLHRMVAPDVSALHRRWTARGTPKLRSFSSLEYGARSWSRTRKVVARLEVGALGHDTRFVVTSLRGGARHLYEDVYCARGQAENLIKLHKTQLASDRTSCHSATANQFRLILHTCAYWLMHQVRAAMPERSAWARADFTTLRLRLIKLAARVSETATRIRISMPTSCPEQSVFRVLVTRLRHRPP